MATDQKPWGSVSVELIGEKPINFRTTMENCTVEHVMAVACSLLRFSCLHLEAGGHEIERDMILDAIKPIEAFIPGNGPLKKQPPNLRSV